MPVSRNQFTCAACPLHTTRRQIVWGAGDPHQASVAFIGEAPGEQEDLDGKPFVGRTGRILEHLIRRTGMAYQAHRVYLTNVVKCRPPANRDPTPIEFNTCRKLWLRDEIADMAADVIVLLGRFAIRQVLSADLTVELSTGIPYRLPVGGRSRILLPIMHPAAGLRSPEDMAVVMDGFDTLARLLRGDYPADQIRTTVLGTTNGEYRLINNHMELDAELFAANWIDRATICVDTETTYDGRALFVQLSWESGHAIVVPADNPDLMRLVARVLAKPTITTVVHNAMFDLPVLESVGIRPYRTLDTMVMAYLSGQPQGLKPLAYRIAGMAMDSYSDVTAVAGTEKYVEFLGRMVEMEWPTPEPELSFTADGEPKVRKPRGPASRAKKVLADIEKAAADGTSVDIPARVQKIITDLGDMISPVLTLPGTDLRDIPLDDAVHYSGRDADATTRVYPELHRRVSDLGMEETLERDMRALKLCDQMQRTGFQVDIPYMEGLSDYFFSRMAEVEERAHRIAGRYVNLGSPDQVAELLYRDMKFPDQGTTDATALQKLSYDDPSGICLTVLEYRQFQKLRSTYSSVIPRLARSDGRVHADIRITRTSTGRLSTANPNLMAIPVRTDEGRKIRGGFVAREGFSLVSADYCLVRTTPVVTTTGIKPIGDVTPGDGVLSNRTSDDTLRFSSVIRTLSFPVPKQNLLQLYLCGRKKPVICTSDHEWITFSGDRVKTADLRPGDRLRHVKAGHAGRAKYPTWYTRSNRSYVYKHRICAEYVHGEQPDDCHVDHINGDVENWTEGNLRYLPARENHAQGGRRYWATVKAGERSDENRLNGLRVGLSKRRSYSGEGNPNYGKRKGEDRTCPQCGEIFYAPPCRSSKFCSGTCYHASRRRVSENYVVDRVEPHDRDEVVCHLEVAEDHTFVLQSGLVSGNSQIEMKVAAFVSQDPNMLEVFLSGDDLHTRTAMWMFGIDDPAKVDKEKHRYPAKRVGFGVLYMISALGLQRQLVAETGDAAYWTVERCQDAIDRWFGAFGRVRDMIEAFLSEARMTGMVTDLFGRKRRVPWCRIPPNVDGKLHEEGLKQAGNAPIQSGAQGLMKQAMGDLVEILPAFEGVVYPVLQIHDDLLWEVRDDVVEDWLGVLIPVMESADQSAGIPMGIPITVDTKVGKRWNELE